MRKFLSVFLALVLALNVFVPASLQAAGSELLPAPWHLAGNNGSKELYQAVPANALAGKSSLTLTYDLHGTCVLGGDASAVIFDQNGWKYVSLSDIGQNCKNGPQTVTVPLTAFGLSPAASLTGQFHSRIWYGSAFTVDITSAVLNDANTPTWPIQGLDVMKYSKDVVCSQPTQATIDAMVQKAVDLGANYVAVSGFYDEPSCGSSTALTAKWWTSIRAKNLKVLFRMKDLASESDYGKPKAVSPDNMRHQKLMVDWIAANPTLVVPGDIFTPFAEPQNGGINGVSYCAQICQFTNAADFNLWLRQVQTMATLSFAALGKTGIKVGYYGFDGFIAGGLGNPDWQGRSFLEPSTIAAMGPVAIDHYPETIGHTMAQDLATLHQALGANTQIVISEWGTITTNGDVTTQVQNTMGAAAADPKVVGFNYWTLGPSGKDWSRDGAWIVTGGRDAQGPALFKIPVDGGATVRLVAGQAVNPVWSPDGNLIVYAGGFMNGQATLLGARPDGTSVELPPVRVRQGGYRFLPDGTGLVYLPLLRSLDFWLLDFATMKTRQLTRLGDQGLLATFDIAPDGKHIVFERTREKSDIVLIDLPK